jgi:hypothetical protein
MPFFAPAENATCFECFPYVCPEPVLAKCSFLNINGAKMPFFAGICPKSGKPIVAWKDLVVWGRDTSDGAKSPAFEPILY